MVRNEYAPTGNDKRRQGKQRHAVEEIHHIDGGQGRFLWEVTFKQDQEKDIEWRWAAGHAHEDSVPRKPRGDEEKSSGWPLRSGTDLGAAFYIFFIKLVHLLGSISP